MNILYTGPEYDRREIDGDRNMKSEIESVGEDRGITPSRSPTIRTLNTLTACLTSLQIPPSLRLTEE